MAVNEKINLTQKEFLGKIIPKGTSGEFDLKMKGRYKVHIPELLPHLEEDEGIWCKNHVHGWRITPSDSGEYGSYYPLHPGTYVMVKFQSNDFNSGYIDRIISDYKDNRDVEAQDCVDVKSSETDRDEQYIIFKTPKKWNIFYVNEETENEPNTIYLVYNRDNGPERRTVFRIDESGLSFYTRDNNRIRIKLDDNKQVDANQTEYIKGYSTEHVDGDKDSHFHANRTETVDGNFEQKTVGNVVIEVSGNTNISVNGRVDVWSGTSINCDAPVINLNSRIANKKSSKRAKPNTSVRDLGPGETSEYELGDTIRENRSVVVNNKCDNVTTSYNNSKRDNNTMDD